MSRDLIFRRWRWRIALVVVALLALLIVISAWLATPRPAAVIPSGGEPVGAVLVGTPPTPPSSDQLRTGAPSTTPSTVPTATPAPSGGIGEPASATNPDLTPPPEPTGEPSDAPPAVRVGKPYGTTTGRASYYGTGGPGFYAALPGRWIRNRTVKVCGPARCLTVRIVTTCGCYTNSRSAKIIDLSIPLFEYVTGWSAAERAQIGVVTVTITVYHPA